MSYRSLSPLPFTPNNRFVESMGLRPQIFNFPTSAKSSAPFNEQSEIFSNKAQNRSKINGAPFVFPTIPIRKQSANLNLNSPRPSNKVLEDNRNKFKQMSEDLNKLKKRLELIMSSNENNSAKQSNKGLNQSTDNLYSPHFRMEEPTTYDINKQNKLKDIDSTKHATSFRQQETIDKNSKDRKSFELNIDIEGFGKQKQKQYKRVSTEPDLNSTYSYTSRPTYDFKTMDAQPLQRGKTVHEQPKSVINYEIQNNNKSQYFNFQQPSIIEQQKINLESIDQKIKEYCVQPINFQVEENVTTSLTPTNQISSSSQKSKVLIESQKQKIQLQSQLSHLKLEKDHLQIQKQTLEHEIKQVKIKVQKLQKNYKIVCEQLQQIKTRERMFRQRSNKLQNQLIDARGKYISKFDDALKKQVDETYTIKQIMDQKNQQISKLTETIRINRRKNQQIINDASAERLKYMTQKKQMEKVHENAIMSKQHQIKTLKIVLSKMESKLQVAIRQNKSKEQFLQKHLVGKVKEGQQKQYIQKILFKYRFQFTTNKLNEAMLEEQKQIERLTKIIEGK